MAISVIIIPIVVYTIANKAGKTRDVQFAENEIPFDELFPKKAVE